VERSAALITALALAAFLLTAGAAGAAIAYATRAGMAAQKGVIDTLSLNGATDGTIAGLFQARFGMLALMGGAAGTVAAALLVAGLRAVGGAGGLTPALPWTWGDVILISPCPLLAATVAVAAARITALTSLGRASRTLKRD